MCCSGVCEERVNDVSICDIDYMISPKRGHTHVEPFVLIFMLYLVLTLRALFICARRFFFFAQFCEDFLARSLALFCSRMPLFTDRDNNGLKKRDSRKERRAKARQENLKENLKEREPPLEPPPVKLPVRTGRGEKVSAQHEMDEDHGIVHHGDDGRESEADSCSDLSGDSGAEMTAQRHHKRRRQTQPVAQTGVEADLRQGVVGSPSETAHRHRGGDEARSAANSAGNVGSGSVNGTGRDEKHKAAEEKEEETLRPMEEVAAEWGLDTRLAQTLREEGVKHFFPIQVCV